MIGKLDTHEIQNLLLSQVIGRLACSDDYQPYIVPITYAYDGEYIYGQTTEGTKLTILRKNPRICFEVDRLKDMVNWQSVIVYGEFEELQDEDAAKAAQVLFDRVFSLTTSSTVHRYGLRVNEEQYDLQPPPFKHVMYRIKITETTGRFETT